MPKYVGPADAILFKERWYRPGDNVPMDAEEVEHHVVFAGQQFEGYDPRSGVLLPTITRPPANPMDDRGQEILLKKAPGGHGEVPDKDQPTPSVVVAPAPPSTAQPAVTSAGTGRGKED